MAITPLYACIPALDYLRLVPPRGCLSELASVSVRPCEAAPAPERPRTSPSPATGSTPSPSPRRVYSGCAAGRLQAPL
jgi:hypothetical protein